MTPTVVPASFRDPAGFVWTDGSNIYRQVSDAHRPHYDRFLSSGLYESLVADGSLVSHEEVADVVSPRPGGYKILRPEIVEFISYPYEWCFSQLRDAALLTLEIQKRALDHGMSLRDASAYNIQFHRGRPVLIDTLSFEILPEGRPWIAYRQFCQHFLAPLVLMAYRDIRLGALSRQHIDGVPLDLAAKLLPRRTRYRPGLAVHIHAQARMQARHARRATSADVSQKQFSLQAFRGILWSLERAVRSLSWEPARSAWRDYYKEAEHYSDRSLEHKRELVGGFLEAAGGSLVWDLGANVGLFGREATRRGMTAVCFDVDTSCVEVNYRQTVAESEMQILPLLCDLTNPSPAIGWANRERSSLAQRGPADVLLALALIHHLAIGNNVPLPMVAEYFAEIGRSAIVEFVPKEDPMTQMLLSTREDIFPGYTRDGFEEAFTAFFEIEKAEPIEGSQRVLYLGRAKG
jgi:hypothetical protein